MTRLSAHAAILAFLGLLATCPALAVAAADGTAEETAAMTRRLHGDLGRLFRLPAALELDPALRTEAEGIAAAHLERMKQLFPAWIQEERSVQAAAGGKPDSGAVFYAVHARMLNELALWQIETGDAQYEQATLAAITSSPLVCRTDMEGQLSDFASRVTRLQAMAPTQRKHALATERRLLEAWGKPRKEVAPWPVPLPQEAAMAAIGQARAGAKPTPLPLPPFLASQLLAEGENYQNLAWESRCAVQQWWLRVGLAQQAAPAAVLNAFRYGTLISAVDRFGKAFEQDAGEAPAPPPASTARPAYPRLAQRFDVTGVTTITRRFDAAGKPVQASITARQIKVAGIRGVRPVAFENTFDAASLRFALANTSNQGSGKPPETFSMDWSLEPPDEPAAGSPAAKKKGARQ